MSASDTMIGNYQTMNSHLPIHDMPQNQLSSETSSTSSELESALNNAVKTPPGTMENGPDGYPSDGSSSVENQPGSNTMVPIQYLNGPVGVAAPVAPTGYTEYVDGNTVVDGSEMDYAGQPSDFDGQPTDYPQEYASTEHVYPGVQTGQDYATNAVPTQVADYQGMGVGDDVSTQGQVHDTGQTAAGQVNKKYIFYLQIKQGEAFPVGTGDQVQYIHGPTFIQLVSSSPVPPPLHTVQTGHGPVSMPTLPVATAPMQLPTGMAIQQPVQEAVVSDMQQQQQAQQPTQQGMYTTCPPPALSPQQMYPPLYAMNGGGGVGNMGGVYPNMIGYTNHVLPTHVQQHHVAPSGVPPTTGMPVPPHHHVHIRYPTHSQLHGHHNSQQQQQQQPHQQQQCNMPDHSHMAEPRPMRSRSRDDRTDKQREKLQKKLRDRQEKNSSNLSPQTSPRGGGGGGGGFYVGGSYNPSVMSVLKMENGANGRQGNGRKKRHSGGGSQRIDENEEDPHLRRLRDLLSNIQPPDVYNRLPRSVSVRWSLPQVHSGNVDLRRDHDIDLSSARFELVLSERNRSGSSKTFYCHGTENEYQIPELKPATEYQLSVCAILDNVKGALSQPAIFETQGCQPDAPLQPRSTGRTKNTLSLRWNPPLSNGSKIHSFLLQCDKGSGSGSFVDVYEGPDKMFKVAKLQPSTLYRFRLQAINDYGASDFSPEVSFHSSGSAPNQPDPPSIREATAHALHLEWAKSTGEINGYILEMDDEMKRYGFQIVYRGEETNHQCKNLARNSEFKFRLCAFNEEGNSQWSGVVAFRTLPATPSAPCKLSLKGKVHSTGFKVSWDPPKDNGGSDITSYCLEMSKGTNDLFVSVYEGLEREFNMDNLEPGHTYRLRAQCSSKGGASQFSDVCSITTSPVCPGQCLPPRLHGKPRATSVNLRWSPPEYHGGTSLQEYTVELMTAADDLPKEVHRAGTCITECTVSALLPGRPYSFRLRAFNRIGGGPFSEPLQINTAPGPPDSPTDLTVTSRSTSVAYVTWEKPCCNGAEVNEYRLERASENGSFSTVYNGFAPFCELKSMQPATFYYLRVQAINSAGPGPFSDVATYESPPSSPEAVASLRLLSSTSESLLIRWMEPNCCGSEILSYNIDIGERPVISVQGNVTEYCLEMLQPNTKYRIRIQAVNSIGVGPYSASLKVTTKALPPDPPRLECVLFSHQSLKLKWGDNVKSPVDVRIQNYTLEMEDRKGRYCVVYCGANVSHKVSKLSEQTSYRFRIFASNDAGDGPYSESYTFTTTKAPPPGLKTPKASLIGEDCCVVEWQALGNIQNDIVIYQCQCQRVRDSEIKLVYRGPGSSVIVPDLTPGTEYRVRTCAIRLPEDGGPELVGTYSSWETFQTDSIVPVTPIISQEIEKEETVLEPKSMEQMEQKLIAAFLVGFFFVAVIFAWIFS